MSWLKNSMISSFSVKIIQEFLMVKFRSNHGLPVNSLSNLFCIVLSLFILATEMLVVHQRAAWSRIGLM